MTTARAPGRVNLMGDHTDYSGGLVMPMAIDLETTVSGTRGGNSVTLRSGAEVGAASIGLDVDEPGGASPAWGRYVAGVVAELRPAIGFEGDVTTTIPIGAGLSSSAALEVAVALALGFEGGALDLALLCQRAEHAAVGVPCGVMDQLASVAGVAGHALRIDCTSLEVEPVAMPEDIDVVVVHSGQSRELTGTAYATRRAECEAATRAVGPLRDATLADIPAIEDAVVRRRARHVITENERVDAFADALRSHHIDELGDLLRASHASLRDDFEVSTPALDALVDQLNRAPGVIGARMTGAGFGGCVVVIARPGSALPGWRVRAAAGASVTN